MNNSIVEWGVPDKLHRLFGQNQRGAEHAGEEEPPGGAGERGGAARDRQDGEPGNLRDPVQERVGGPRRHDQHPVLRHGGAQN